MVKVIITIMVIISCRRQFDVEMDNIVKRDLVDTLLSTKVLFQVFKTGPSVVGIEDGATITKLTWVGVILLESLLVSIFNKDVLVNSGKSGPGHGLLDPMHEHAHVSKVIY